APDLTRDVLQGFAAALLDGGRVDRVEPERRANRLGRHLALLQSEQCLLELRHHLAAAHEPEIAAARRRPGIFGELLRELAEVFPRLRAADDVDDLAPRLVLRLASTRLGDADQDMRSAD